MAIWKMSSFCRMTHSICKTKTDFKILRKCFNSTQMVNSRCVSSNKHQQTLIALHGPRTMAIWNMSLFCRMTHSICKTKTDFKIPQKCFSSTQMVNSRCVSSNKHQQTIIALHGPYDGNLELTQMVNSRYISSNKHQQTIIPFAFVATMPKKIL